MNPTKKRKLNNMSGVPVTQNGVSNTTVVEASSSTSSTKDKITESNLNTKVTALLQRFDDGTLQKKDLQSFTGGITALVQSYKKENEKLKNDLQSKKGKNNTKLPNGPLMNGSTVVANDTPIEPPPEIEEFKHEKRLACFEEIHGIKPRGNFFVEFYPSYLTIKQQSKVNKCEDTLDTIIAYRDIDKIVSLPYKKNGICFLQFTKIIALRWRKSNIDCIALDFEDESDLVDPFEMDISNLGNSGLPATLKGTTESVFLQILVQMSKKPKLMHNRALFKIQKGKETDYHMQAISGASNVNIYPTQTGLFLEPKPLQFVARENIIDYSFPRAGEQLRYFDLRITTDLINPRNSKPKIFNFGMIPKEALPEIDFYFNSIKIPNADQKELEEQAKEEQAAAASKANGVSKSSKGKSSTKASLNGHTSAAAANGDDGKTYASMMAGGLWSDSEDDSEDAFNPEEEIQDCLDTGTVDKKEMKKILKNIRKGKGLKVKRRTHRTRSQKASKKEANGNDESDESSSEESGTVSPNKEVFVDVPTKSKRNSRKRTRNQMETEDKESSKKDIAPIDDSILDQSESEVSFGDTDSEEDDGESDAPPPMEDIPNGTKASDTDPDTEVDVADASPDTNIADLSLNSKDAPIVINSSDSDGDTAMSDKVETITMSGKVKCESASANSDNGSQHSVSVSVSQTKSESETISIDDKEPNIVFVNTDSPTRAKGQKKITKKAKQSSALISKKKPKKTKKPPKKESETERKSMSPQKENDRTNQQTSITSFFGKH